VKRDEINPELLKELATSSAVRTVGERVDFVGAHQVLTSAAGMAAQTEVAAASLWELRRVQPTSTWAGSRRKCRSKLEAEREHYLEGFRRAGLDQLRLARYGLRRFVPSDESVLAQGQQESLIWASSRCHAKSASGL
jgi:hypothetical protein